VSVTEFECDFSSPVVAFVCLNIESHLVIGRRYYVSTVQYFLPSKSSPIDIAQVRNIAINIAWTYHIAINIDQIDRFTVYI